MAQQGNGNDDKPRPPPPMNVSGISVGTTIIQKLAPPAPSMAQSSPPPPSQRPLQRHHPPSNSSATHLPEERLPSVLRDKTTPSEERLKRRRTCRFLEEVGRSLRLPRVAIATSMTFLHRFYAVHSFDEHDRFEVGVACVLLAAKAEECPKKVGRVLGECWRIRYAGMAAANKKNPVQRPKNVDRNGNLDSRSEEFVTLRERVLLLERIVLHTIGFEVMKMMHPQSKQLESTAAATAVTTKHALSSTRLLQCAVNFANDSMHTSLCLQFPPETIAMACIYMGALHCNLTPTQGRAWFDVLRGNYGGSGNNSNGGGLDIESLASIAFQIMELIADKKGFNPSMFDGIRSDLERMGREGCTAGSSTRTDRGVGCEGDGVAGNGDTRSRQHRHPQQQHMRPHPPQHHQHSQQQHSGRGDDDRGGGGGGVIGMKNGGGVRDGKGTWRE